MADPWVTDSPTAPAEKPLPKTAQPLADEAKDLKALKKTMEDAASVSGTLWLSYLFALFYLFIASAAVTHEQLFFERGVKLPFLNIDLPLKGFFWLGPLIFIVLHTYVLLHFVLLAGKVGEFNTQLRDQISDEDTRERIRLQLPSNIFVQFLGAPREIRHGLIGWLLRAIAWISLIIGPVALLVFFQLQFLPYHDEAITWWQRIAVVIDIVLLWTLWPAVARGNSFKAAWIDWRSWRPVMSTLAITCSVLAALVVSTIATFPGEWLHDALPTIRYPLARKFEEQYTFHTLLVAGDVDDIANRPKSLFSNVLVLPGLDGFDRARFDTEAKFAAVRETISLRGRRLERAVLIGANLRKADLTGAQLQGASLMDAQLQGALLRTAQLQGADLKNARLQGASLISAQLQGADLNGAQLHGADLNFAQLQGANLNGAWLQDALLNAAQLQGATLLSAQLQGADLSEVQLQGGPPIGAQLQGADLREARLQGALLIGAQLQGAFLENAQLQGASLVKICAWQADVRSVKPEAIVRVVDAHIWVNSPLPEGEEPEPCHWEAGQLRQLERDLRQVVPMGGLQDQALKRVGQNLDPARPLPDAPAMQTAWRRLAENSPAEASFDKARAHAWQSAGCAAEGAPHVIRGLLLQFSRFGAQQWQRTLAATFLDPKLCPAAAKLTDDDKTRLIAIRDFTPPPK